MRELGGWHVLARGQDLIVCAFHEPLLQLDDLPHMRLLLGLQIGVTSQWDTSSVRGALLCAHARPKSAMRSIAGVKPSGTGI